MSNLPKYKGFTLVELLVVIAIIGVLSSVVLASLNTARGKGANAAIKANMANMRAQAELYYDSTGANSYGSAATASSCGVSNTVFSDPVITNAILSSQNANGGVAAVCKSSGTPATAWAMSTQLKVADPNGNLAWCTDSTGNSKSEPLLTTMTSSVCP